MMMENGDSIEDLVRSLTSNSSNIDLKGLLTDNVLQELQKQSDLPPQAPFEECSSFCGDDSRPPPQRHVDLPTDETEFLKDLAMPPSKPALPTSSTKKGKFIYPSENAIRLEMAQSGFVCDTERPNQTSLDESVGDSLSLTQIMEVTEGTAALLACEDSFTQDSGLSESHNRSRGGHGHSYSAGCGLSFGEHSGADIGEGAHASSSANAFSTAANDFGINRGKDAFQGFQTAHGMQVSVSESSLVKAKRLMAEIESEDKVHQTHSSLMSLEVGNPSQFQGFQTAGGKKVSFSEASLTKAKRLMSEVESEDVHLTKSPSEISEGKKPPQFQGFQTAGGKKVSFSEASLAKARKLMSEVESEDVHHTPSLSELSEAKKLPKGRGFQTAGGKKVSFSEASMAKARRLMTEIESEDQVVSSKENRSAQFQGFQTAGGKQVSVSESSLTHARRLVAEIDGEDSCGSTGLSTVGRSQFQGFQTASKKGIAVSDGALAKAEQLISEVSREAEAEFGPRNSLIRRTLTDYPLNSPRAVSTPNEKKFPRQLLQRKQVFGRRAIGEPANSDASAPPTSLDWNRSDDTGGGCGFQSASGRTMKVSDAALSKAKTFMSEIATEMAGEAPLDSSTSLQRPGKEQSSRPLASGKKRFQTSSHPGFKPPLLSAKPMGNGSRGGDVDLDAEEASLDARVDERWDASVSRAAVGDLSTFVPQEDVQHDAAASPTSGPANRRPAATDVSAAGDRPEGDSRLAAVLDMRAISRRRQAALIRQRSGAKTAAQPGLLWSLRRDRRAEVAPLHEYFHGATPSHKAPVMLPEVAADYKFYCGQDRPTYEAGDAGVLIPDVNGMAGREEVANCFLTLPGVEARLVSIEWISNHYKWIVWKLYCMKSSFHASFFPHKYFSPHHVLLQLKLRYDREIDHCQRSPLKRIYEQDDTPGKRMVLLVHEIIPTENNIYKVGLTDGWYSIRAVLDALLSRQVTCGRLRVGTKLLTAGTDWFSARPEPCSPLEARTGEHSLRLHGNSTRRARWDAKLGFCRRLRPFPVSVSSVRADGGAVACTDVLVQRCFPLQFMERLADGGRVFRSEKAEQIAAQRYADERRRRMESAFQRLTTADRAAARQMSDAALREVSSGEELHALMAATSDPEGLQARLSEPQREALDRHRQQQMESLFRDDAAARHVSMLLKVRVTGVASQADRDLRPTLLLTVWAPGQEVLELVREGALMRIYNVNAVAASAGSWQDAGSSGCGVNLSANRHSRFCPAPFRLSEPAFDGLFQPRQTLDVAALSRLLAAGDAPFREADCEGVVAAVEAAGSGHLVFLTDESEQVAVVKVWGGLDRLKLLAEVRPNACLHFENLQLRPTALHSDQGPLLHFWELSAVHSVTKRRLGVGPVPPESLVRVRELLRRRDRPATPQHTPADSRLQQRLARLERASGGLPDPLETPATPLRARARTPGLTPRRAGLSLAKHREAPPEEEEEPDRSIADLVKTRKRRSVTDSQERQWLARLCGKSPRKS